VPNCKFIVMPGMEILEMSQELKWCLRSKLPSDTPVSSEDRRFKNCSLAAIALA